MSWQTCNKQMDIMQKYESKKRKKKLYIEEKTK